ncbi:MAG: Exopolysaccharide synthesis, ExoD, partial [uncultured Gemmatimonadetes bacterium]
ARSAAPARVPADGPGRGAAGASVPFPRQPGPHHHAGEPAHCPLGRAAPSPARQRAGSRAAAAGAGAALRPHGDGRHAAPRFPLGRPGTGGTQVAVGARNGRPAALRRGGAGGRAAAGRPRAAAAAHQYAPSGRHHPLRPGVDQPGPSPHALRHGGTGGRGPALRDPRRGGGNRGAGRHAGASPGL